MICKICQLHQNLRNSGLIRNLSKVQRLATHHPNYNNVTRILSTPSIIKAVLYETEEKRSALTVQKKSTLETRHARTERICLSTCKRHEKMSRFLHLLLTVMISVELKTSQQQVDRTSSVAQEGLRDQVLILIQASIVSATSALEAIWALTVLNNLTKLCTERWSLTRSSKDPKLSLICQT